MKIQLHSVIMLLFILLFAESTAFGIIAIRDENHHYDKNLTFNKKSSSNPSDLERKFEAIKKTISELKSTEKPYRILPYFKNVSQDLIQYYQKNEEIDQAFVSEFLLDFYQLALNEHDPSVIITNSGPFITSFRNDGSSPELLRVNQQSTERINEKLRRRKRNKPEKAIVGPPPPPPLPRYLFVIDLHKLEELESGLAATVHIKKMIEKCEQGFAGKCTEQQFNLFDYPMIAYCWCESASGYTRCGSCQD